jgi:hypothetical protein
LGKTGCRGQGHENRNQQEVLNRAPWHMA